MASTSSIVSHITYALYLGAGEHTALTCAKDQTMVVSMPRSPKVALATACLFLGSSDQRIWAFPRTAGLDNEEHLSTATRKKRVWLTEKSVPTPWGAVLDSSPEQKKAYLKQNHHRPRSHGTWDHFCQAILNKKKTCTEKSERMD